MAKQVFIESLKDCPDSKYLGSWPKREDYPTIFREDVDVHLPNGDLIVFRKGVLKGTLPVEKGGALTPEAHKYWQWVSKALRTDQRGMASGREITTNPEIRLTIGQSEFFSKATRAKNPLVDADEARALIESDTRPSRNTYYVKRAEESGYVDLEEVEKWDSIVRKKSLPKSERDEATILRNKAKLAWFNNWFEREWLPAEDRASVAKAARKYLVTSQPRSNMCWSNVVGAVVRSGRIPYGRLSVSTLKRWDDFLAQKPLFHEVNDLFRELMPEAFADLNERFSKVKDERYNFFGTAFTSATVNNNYQVAVHYDGQNAVNGKAALFVMEQGDWSGGEFCFPQLGVGFDIREGDILIGDNQSLQHCMLPFEFHSDDAENVMFVLYAKEDLIKMDDLDCENCRRDFLAYAKENLRHKAEGKNLAKWEGGWPQQWRSPEWVEFKRSQGMERCSNTNYKLTEDISDEEVLAEQNYSEEHK